MTTFALGLDRHYYPVTIPSGAQLSIGGAAVTLTAGVYWAHDDAAPPTGYPSFYAHLRTRLNAVVSGTWTVEPIAPGGYPLRSGVRLVRASATALSVNWDATTPIIKQLLGWPAGQAGTTALALVGSTRVLDGPWAALGSWCPWSLYDGRAEGKDSTRARVTEWSSDHPEVAQPIVWRERKLRLCSYPLVWGAHVLRERARIADVAALAGVGLGDDHNALERLWAEAGRELGGVIVVHDAELLDLKIGAHAYDLCKLATRQAAESLDQLASRSPIAADLWQVRIPYVVTGGNYGL